MAICYTEEKADNLNQLLELIGLIPNVKESGLIEEKYFITNEIWKEYRMQNEKRKMYSIFERGRLGHGLSEKMVADLKENKCIESWKEGDTDYPECYYRIVFKIKNRYSNSFFNETGWFFVRKETKLFNCLTFEEIQKLEGKELSDSAIKDLLKNENVLDLKFNNNGDMYLLCLKSYSECLKESKDSSLYNKVKVYLG